ncbi:MAG: replicative DNA helicase [Candidatus Puniceispirillales bacterium WSBS_2018_MAG_OTU23]
MADNDTTPEPPVSSGDDAHPAGGANNDANIVSLPVTVHDAALNSNMNLAKPMPHNLEAEQGLLGALLVDNGIIEDINDALGEDHFYDPVHGRIFAALRRLTSRGQLANPITLKSYFVGDTAFDQVDIESYLNELVEAVISLSDAPDYAEDIRQCFLRRSLIQLSDGVIHKARTADLDMTAEVQIEEAEQQLFTLAEHDQTQTGLVPFSNALTKAIEMAEFASKSAGGLSGIGTGLRDLNKLTGGFQRSDLIILAGRPGMGKTALATNIAFHAATTTLTDETPQHIAFFSLEMSSEQLANRILSESSGISSEHIRRGDLNPNQFNDLVRASGTIEGAPIYIDDTPSLSISQLASRARRLKRQQGLGLIVVDYLQLLSAPLGQRAENRVQEISVISRTLKSIAKELNVPVLALSQLSRAVEQREDKRPNLSDLRESGSIEQDADVVMFVYREEYYLGKSEPEQRAEESQEHFNTRYGQWKTKLESAEGKAEIIIAKQRHGPTGVIKPNFIAEQTKFVDGISDERLPEGY